MTQAQKERVAAAQKKLAAFDEDAVLLATGGAFIQGATEAAAMERALCIRDMCSVCRGETDRFESTPVRKEPNVGWYHDPAEGYTGAAVRCGASAIRDRVREGGR